MSKYPYWKDIHLSIITNQLADSKSFLALVLSSLLVFKYPESSVPKASMTMHLSLAFS
ncbi:hypothetical protein PHYBLDRAFT_144546 [Phycomyces blakesleeanus NRRL 1555(-)]|uniref:Uncharacterized protein n=1 Tax=Phycomyces blakesleeanus (strain ATCC 8743b / DSM 1359 / FGSC 10004 / NBRC 33097 / NRRL 1555) TaxID=763407 RepID=A0A162NGU0_PHYB8|nr:hypothetical protein PHYBLDRAFT_144546 [Phycomyces blakesleeanus NRRL 1555(-)]OAD74088.1 hypothetical protein PHYBLDRAFT_144546 [Phycomyces blakesleeanus NRRL 1555(-)]|eukprot:XP_018292128.1 hypothetical protein PHYBLDRAFT_144546 [Phycomyces blakesleeanus NRRL 1555(-)]